MSEIHQLRAEHHLENVEAFTCRHSERRRSVRVVIKGSEALDLANSALAHNLYAWACRFWRSGLDCGSPTRNAGFQQ
jgi:hypothetical protein